MNTRQALQKTTDALLAVLAWANTLNYSVDALDAAHVAVREAGEVLAETDCDRKAIFMSALRRAEAQHERPGAKRDRCALDIVCGASIALHETGNTVAARAMEHAAFLVSLRGAVALKELIK